MIDFDDEVTGEFRQAYCATCRDVVTVDAEGCMSCREEGVVSAGEPVIAEGVPDGSPRQIECPTCGTDPGQFCYPSEDGNGWNHVARVETASESDAIDLPLPHPSRCSKKRIH